MRHIWLDFESFSANVHVIIHKIYIFMNTSLLDSSSNDCDCKYEVTFLIICYMRMIVCEWYYWLQILSKFISQLRHIIKKIYIHYMRVCIKNKIKLIDFKVKK